MALFKSSGNLNLDPISTGVSAIGGIGGLLAGQSAANAQKEMSRRQAQIIQRQGQLFAQAQPYYGQLLQSYANQAGLGGGLQQTAPGQFQANRQQFGLGGNWGAAEDQLRLRQGEEDINRQARMGENQLRFRLGQSGVADASLAAALARNQATSDQNYAGFRRQLAIQAPEEQYRRLGVLQNALGMGFGQGGAASAGYGQQAGMYGQQAAQDFSQVGNILSNYMYERQLQNYNRPPAAIRNAPGGIGGYGSQWDIDPGGNPVYR